MLSLPVRPVPPVVIITSIFLFLVHFFKYFFIETISSLTFSIGVPVSAIDYCYNDQFLSTNDALHSDLISHGQVRVRYENGLEVHANLGWEHSWTVHRDDQDYSLPPGSFCAWNEEGLLVYSIDNGTGRIDFASCEDYLFIDTRGQKLEFGPVKLDGAALIKERKWEIDVVPFNSSDDIIIDVGQYWPDRKLPPLRMLVFDADKEEPDVHRADMEGELVHLKPIEGRLMYRITLPEWMVEPGQ